MCDMHGMTPQQISFDDATKILDYLAQNKFLMVYFTGGEPTLHPDLVKMVNYANELGLVTTMTTNGTARKELFVELKKAGLYAASVSLDHWNATTCEQIRGYESIMKKQVETLQFLKNIGVRTYALAFLNSFLIDGGVEKLVEYTNKIVGVPFGFCYPTTSNVNTYHLGSSLVEKEDLVKLRKSIETILKLKKSGFEVANLTTYMEDTIDQEQGKNLNFYCKAGEDVVYIDWFGDVYPCFLKGKLFNLLQSENKQLQKNVKCNDCYINCFREPSILPQLLHPRLFVKEIYYAFSTRKIYQ